MHAFTLTLHSYANVKNLSDLDLENITEQYAAIFDDLLVKHGLDEYFTTEVYWRRGCFEICLQFLAIDPALWSTLIETAKSTAAATNAALGFIVNYWVLKDRFFAAKKDVSQAKIEYKNVIIKPSEIHECNSKPNKKANKLSRKQKKIAKAEKKLARAQKESDKDKKTKK